MKSGITWCVVVAAFVAGLGLGSVLRGPDESARNDVPRAMAERVVKYSSELTTLLDGIPIDPVPTGDGKITGRVTKIDGTPVAGAVIIARAHVDLEREPERRDPGTRPPKFDPQTAMSYELRTAVWSSKTEREARSRENGNYEVGGLADVDYYLAAYVPGHRTYLKKRASRVSPGDVVDFVACAPGEKRPRPERERTDTPIVRLVVEFPSTMETAPFEAWLIQKVSDRKPSMVELRSGGQWRRGGGPLARIEWSRLKPGPYFVCARLGQGNVIGDLQWAVVDVSHGIQDVTLRFDEPSGEDVIPVMVLGPNGALLTKVGFSAVHKSGRSMRSGSIGGAARRKDGAFLVMLSDTNEYRGGTHVLTATTMRFGSVSTKVDPTSSELVVVRFQEPALVSARIAGFVGSGFEGRLRVAIEDPIVRSVGAGFLATLLPQPSAKGHLSARTMQPGEKVLALYLLASAHHAVRVAKKRVTLKSGHQEVEIAVPALHRFRVVWTGEGRPQCSLQRVDAEIARSGDYGQKTVGPDKTATYDGLLPGTYKLIVWGAGERTDHDVDIPAQTELTLP